MIAPAAQLVKIYGKDKQGRDVVVRTEHQPVFGTPNIDLVSSTSYVERSNLTIRMVNRRFTFEEAFAAHDAEDLHASRFETPGVSPRFCGWEELQKLECI